MGCTRILHYNLTDLDKLAARYVSSEQTAYPSNNVYNKNRRSKVWRTNGYWDLVTGTPDTTIVFRESVGVDLTATVVAAAYTSDATFFAAIKTALEAVGASTYTISRDTTSGKVKITSDGSGGGGILQLMWTNAASADMADLLGFSTAANDTGSLTYTADLLRIHSYEFLKWDLGTAHNPQAFVITGAINSVLNTSSSAVIKLQGNSTDAWSSPAYEATLTYYDNVFFIIADTTAAGLHTAPLRFWRFYVEDKDNPDLYLEFNNVFLGDYYIPTRGAPVFPLESEYIDNSNTVNAENGNVIADQRPQTLRISLNWQGLTSPERESLLEIYNTYGLHTPLFIDFDSQAAFSSSENIWLKIVRFDSQPQDSLVSPNNWSLSTNFREEI